jgi:hypothetical protein
MHRDWVKGGGVSKRKNFWLDSALENREPDPVLGLFSHSRL